MTLFAIDLDGTILSNVARMEKAGPEPSRADMPSYLKWLEVLMDRETMLLDKPIPGMREFVWSLINGNLVTRSARVVYVTARNENLREITRTWLERNNFPMLDLFMRPEHDVQSNHELKQSILKSFEVDNIVMIDDDPGNELQAVCLEEGWTMLKATTCLPK